MRQAAAKLSRAEDLRSEMQCAMSMVSARAPLSSTRLLTQDSRTSAASNERALNNNAAQAEYREEADFAERRP